MHTMVSVKHVSASYGKISCLANVSLMVETGSIYALLGPSGCGKTTLLSCILGRKCIDSGVILVNSKSPGDRSNGLPGPLVGYMPQDISLYQDLTIKETFQFFGKLQKMSTDLVKKRQGDICEMLELPEESRKIQAMSGGQKRRLSFAVALLHSPEILILDEPTVGVDPLVRKRIWDHLESLCSSGVTTIITTHYVEEARQANSVGIMRQGKVLAQEDPGTLMERFQTSTLESAFLHLCQQDVQDIGIADTDEMALSASELPATDSGLNGHKFLNIARNISTDHTKIAVNWPSLSNISALTIKNMISYKRNLLLLFLLFISPAMFVVLNCLAIGNKPRTIPIGVVNLESNCSDKSFTRTCEADMLGCYFELSLNGSEEFTIKSFSSVSQMMMEAKRAKVWATFIVPQNFSVSYLKRILKTDDYAEFIYFYDIIDDELIGENEKIYISIDMSFKPIAGFIRESIKKLLTRFQEKVRKMCEDDIGDDFDSDVVFDPTASLGDEDFGFLEYILPGNIVMPIYFMALARTAEAFIGERSQGLLERSWIAGVLPFEILVSFILSHFFAMCIQVFSAMFTVFVVFKRPCVGPIFWYVVLILFQGFTGLCNGFFLSTVCRTASDAMLLATVNTFLSVIACGNFWPLACMKYQWMESLAWYLPHTATLQGARDITLRGWGIEAQSVRHGLGISAGWSLLYFTASWALVIRLK